MFISLLFVKLARVADPRVSPQYITAMSRPSHQLFEKGQGIFIVEMESQLNVLRSASADQCLAPPKPIAVETVM